MDRVSRACLLLFVSLLGVAAVEAAPAPQPRRRPPTRPLCVVPGEYIMTWQGDRWQTTLLPGGGYSADRHGLVFSGDYAWDGRERVLTIREGFGRIPPPPSRRIVYRITMDRGLTGRTQEGAGVRLVRVR